MVAGELMARGPQDRDKLPSRHGGFLLQDCSDHSPNPLSPLSVRKVLPCFVGEKQNFGCPRRGSSSRPRKE